MGWIPVCDQKPTKDGWVPVVNPMRGIRYLDMDDGTGYLAVRYDKARYIYEGVPQKIPDVLIRHRGASIYFRQQVRNKYPCVDILKYESPEAYQADDGPVREKLERMSQKRIEEASKPRERDLFGNVATPGSRTGRRLKRC